MAAFLAVIFLATVVRSAFGFGEALIAVPLLVLIALIAQSGAIMGSFRSGPLSRVLLWTTAAVMGGAAIGMFATLGH